jgi:hypothetical protein
MSFIGGIIQSILTDVVKDFLLKPRSTKASWGCGCLLLIVFISVLILFGILLNLSGSGDKKIDTEEYVWKNVKIGDSLFVRDSYGIDFYKKGKVKLTQGEQREVRYAYDERIDFIEVNHVTDKFFFKNKTSFLGMCTGIDSMTGQWIMIKPSQPVTHPPKRKDDYDFETRRWENKMYDILHDTKLSKEFYVRASDVVLKNNDNLFK